MSTAVLEQVIRDRLAERDNRRRWKLFKFEEYAAADSRFVAEVLAAAGMSADDAGFEQLLREKLAERDQRQAQAVHSPGRREEAAAADAWFAAEVVAAAGHAGRKRAA